MTPGHWTENAEFLKENGLDSPSLKNKKIVIKKFWKKDIQMKDKKLNDEDYSNYVIKGWDIDKKIKKLFGKNFLRRRV